MADSKISALPASTTPLAGTEVLPIVQSSTTVKVSVANLTAGRAISATQLTLTTDNLIIGTAGKGVDFSANTASAGMTSELLTWYEEGTWTPIDSSGASLSFTGTANNCFYTRVGNVVTANFMLTFPTTASTTAVSIGGLPFTSKATTNGVSVVAISYTDYAVAIAGRITQNASTFSLFASAAGTTVTNVNMTGRNLRGTAVYLV